uniref:Uncharacterized protein n=1 Tax=Anguilla anguilla TaxID=7936 RepID=A0A0E9WBI1_ANGAN
MAGVRNSTCDSSPVRLYLTVQSEVQWLSIKTNPLAHS